MGTNWYALRAKQRKEETVYRQACDKGWEVFYPRLRVNPVNPRARKYQPYFPGYLFIKTDLDAVGSSALQWMPHSHGLVQFGGEPAVVPDNLIYAIRQRVEEIARAGGANLDGLNPGDLVQINFGPFEGFQAIFDVKIPGSERVRVLLKLLDSRNIPLELSASSISKKR